MGDQRVEAGAERHRGEHDPQGQHRPEDGRPHGHGITTGTRVEGKAHTFDRRRRKPPSGHDAG